MFIQIIHPDLEGKIQEEKIHEYDFISENIQAIQHTSITTLPSTCQYLHFYQQC